MVSDVELRRRSPVPGDSRVLTPGRAGAGGPSRPALRPDARNRLLDRRRERQRRFDAGELPGPLPETAAYGTATGPSPPAPADLDDRRVEITGPAEPKMMINALNSGARVFMADFEDALSPPWTNVIGGQVNCMDAVRRTLEYTSPEGKRYRLGEQLATLVVRPRGWHLEEAHAQVDGRPVPASLFDFGLYFHHNARELLARGSGPYFYLPKLESHLEARLWNEVFEEAQRLARRAAGNHPRHGADRDDRGRVRDGRDSVRAPRARRRAQRRPLGLHLQHHQEIRATGPSSCCPIARR